MSAVVRLLVAAIILAPTRADLANVSTTALGDDSCAFLQHSAAVDPLAIANHRFSAPTQIASVKIGDRLDRFAARKSVRMAGFEGNRNLSGTNNSFAVFSAYLPSLNLVAGHVSQRAALNKSLWERVVDKIRRMPKSISFEGIGEGLNSRGQKYMPRGAPPDTTGAAGETQYVQFVNTEIGVFAKTTGRLVLSVSGNAPWQPLGIGSPCATENDGDPIVQYDQAARRWVLSQFALTQNAGYWHCVAVSTSSDATGGYNLYAFEFPTFPDYPKLGVWPDGYYVTFNTFGTSGFQGARACAYDRVKMLKGLPGTKEFQQCFQLSSNFYGLQPSDLDGETQPPQGSPNYLVSLDDTQYPNPDKLLLWRFHVDWLDAGSSVLTGPIAIPVGKTRLATCGSVGVSVVCIPQKGTDTKLDSIADLLMFRLAYRVVDGVERMVVNHAVNTSLGNSAIRWYEIRNPSTQPTIFQQGSFSPDSSYRWMGSAAMDKMGNMAVGYSISSSSMHPGLAYATRRAEDPLGELHSETTIINGQGSQLDSSRWGDYTHMSIDPVDDCTFWYTGQYLTTDGLRNWNTRITSFKLSSCKPAATASWGLH